MVRAYVIGDVILDKYIHGKIERISTEAPVPIFRNDCVEFRLGGAANVALNMKRMGANISILLNINKDDEWGTLNSMLNKENISVIHIDCESKSKSILKTRLLCDSQQVFRIDEDPQQPDISNYLNSTFIKVLNDGDVVVISDYGKGTIGAGIESFIKKLNSKNVTCIVDAKGSLFNQYAEAAMVKVNSNELKKHLGIELSAQYKEFIRNLSKNMLFRRFLITDGENGMIGIHEHENFTIDSFTQEVFDSTGVGDTVIAAIGVGYINGLNFYDSCKTANYAASIAVKHRGCYAVSENEIKNMISNYGDK